MTLNTPQGPLQRCSCDVLPQVLRLCSAGWALWWRPCSGVCCLPAGIAEGEEGDDDWTGEEEDQDYLTEDSIDPDGHDL